VSWQIASLALVVAALAACFWWYERTRPSSKEVALVATMAALGALGRDAFAAIPDVKPTTAITFVCGYAFGPGPGFAVGAVGALASNIFLGQGSWTPWQMLAWGIVGLGGAALGRLFARRPLRRVALALCCAVAAEAFNLLIDFYTWTQGATHTLAAYGAWLASAFSFDLTHVIASFLFGLAFGPALLRMLMRARARMEIVWEPVGVTGALVVVALVAVAGLHAGASAQASLARIDVSREIAYLQAAQNADGGFGAAPGQASGELYSGWAAMGLAAAGRNPLSVRRDGYSVLYALRGEASSLEGAGDLERTILALRACGVSVHSLPGVGAGGDPVKALLAFRDRNGSFGDLSNLTAFAVFALRASGYSAADPLVRSAGRWLAEQQDSDGGFGFATRGAGSDVDDTAAVVQALFDSGAPRTGTALGRATAFLIHAQNPDGGYPQQLGGQSNAQSTAWAIQGLIAAGRNPAAVTREGSRSPLGYLESLVAPDGSVRYSRTGSQTPVWVTAQALTALAGKTFPIAPLSARAALTPPPARTAAVAPPPVRAAIAPPTPHTAATASAGLDGLARAIGALIGTALAPMLG
jgi:energy-coupling factor transport system substrate-specific component